jgi:hypothetical protein
MLSTILRDIEAIGTQSLLDSNASNNASNYDHVSVIVIR